MASHSDDRRDRDRERIKQVHKMKNNKKMRKREEDGRNDERKGRKKPKSKKRKVLKVILIIFLTLFILGLITAGVAVGAFFGIYGDELKINKEDLVVGAINSKVVDKDGNFLAVIAGNEKRQVVSIDEMAEYLPKAYVAIEDERFYEHHGIDIKRTGGAIFTYLFGKGSSTYGGSTITQQVVKNITNDDERSGIEGVLRKIKEWGRAYNIENILSKQQILELYLNLIFIGGSNLHGVELGAQYYFDKSAKELSLAECAFMAGINSGPALYNAFSEEEEMINKIKNKTKVVLNKMKELNFIENSEEYDNAIAEVDNGLAFQKGRITTQNLSYHTEAALNEIVNDYMKEKGCTRDLAELYLYSSGLTIYTTQDTFIQESIEDEYHESDWIKNSKKTKDENGEWKTTQSAMVIIDHKTGYVVGTVGGLGDKTPFGLNRATQSTRQTGSSMKPLASIAPAIEAGKITAGSVFDDVPTNFGNYTPKNYYGSYKGLSTVRYAIEISQNIIPMKILQESGITEAIDFLEALGITSAVRAKDNKEHNDESVSLAIGGMTYGVSPLEMAGAYATFANDGVYIEPTFYTKVVDSNGTVVLESKQETRRVMTEENAYIMKSILTQPVVGRDSLVTASGARVTGMEVAAKTGTTDSDYDRWLCGFTPYYTGAVWFGFDDNETIPYGANPSTRIFHNVMEVIHKDLPNARFEVPKKIVRVEICKCSGQLATDDCKNAINGDCSYTEVYVDGTQPKEECTTHVRARVCQLAGDEEEEPIYVLSNEWCPDAEEIVFITRENSEESEGWKRAADAKFMLPTETCSEHLKNEKEEPKDGNTVNSNTIGNTVDANTINGNMVNNVNTNTVDTNTIGNNVNTNSISNTTNEIGNTVNSNTVNTNTVDNENGDNKNDNENNSEDKQDETPSNGEEENSGTEDSNTEE